jgi:hypothetical protein
VSYGIEIVSTQCPDPPSTGSHSGIENLGSSHRLLNSLSFKDLSPPGWKGRVEQGNNSWGYWGYNVRFDVDYVCHWCTIGSVSPVFISVRGSSSLPFVVRVVIGCKWLGDISEPRFKIAFHLSTNGISVPSGVWQRCIGNRTGVRE